MSVNQLSKEEYKDLEKKLNVHPLQSFSWGELKKPGWKPIRWGVFDGNEPLSILTILTKKIPVYGKMFGYIPRGLAVKKKKYLQEVLKLLPDTGYLMKLTHLMIDPDVEFGSGLKGHGSGEIEDIFRDAGFKPSGLQIQPNRTVVLDLSRTEEELLSEMRSKHRQYIRKAKRSGVTIRVGTKSDVDHFVKIIEEIVNKKGYILHEGDYYRKIWDLFGENVDIFIAEAEGEVVGAYMVLYNNDCAYEMYGGCSEKGNALLANYLMKWFTIRHAKKLGKKHYDQWGAEFKYPGLVQFKEGFGGTVVDFPPQFTYVFDKIGYAIYRLMDRVNRWRQGFGR